MFDIVQNMIFALSKANQRLLAIFREEFKDYCITSQQFILLANLWETDGLSQHELSRNTGIDRTTVAGIIGRLETAELIVRKPSSKDNRACQVWLTEKVRELEPGFCRAVCRIRHRIEDRLTPAEHKQLKLLLIKLLQTGEHAAWSDGSR